MAISFFTATVTTPGTSQPLTSSITPAFPTITGTMTGTILPNPSVIVFQADSLNTAAANVYIGGKSMVVSTRTAIGMELAPGQFSPAISLAEGAVGLNEIWIDGATGATKLHVTVVG